MSAPPLLGLPRAGRYRIVLADPPWRFETRSPQGAGRSPDRHYPTMTVEEIAALPVARIAAPDAVLFLWVYSPLLDRAFEVIRAWGFNYRSLAFVWLKTTRAGWPRISTGYHTRQEVELCLLATRGRGYRRADRGVRQVIVEPPREHSRKPDEAVRRIERLVGRGPAVELFARTQRPGWDAWGNEVTKFEEVA